MTRSSSLLPIHYAIVTALTGDTTGLHSHVEDRIYDYAPENPTCPYLVIRTPTEAPWDFLGNGIGQRDTFTIDIWSQYRGSKETKEIIQHINDVLDNSAIAPTGYTNVWIYNTMSTDMRDPDGIHWHGIMYFTIYVTKS